MTIRADSYGSVDEVTALTRYLLGGQTAFNSTTQPTLSEVETFIDRASGALNSEIAAAGLGTPIVNSTAKLSCDDWVVQTVSEMVNDANPSAASSGDASGGRFLNLSKYAKSFVKYSRLGWLRLGVTESHGLSEGLAFTGQDTPADRSDPTDTTLEQPKFKRGLFDGNGVNYTDDIEDD